MTRSQLLVWVLVHHHGGNVTLFQFNLSKLLPAPVFRFPSVPTIHPTWRLIMLIHYSSSYVFEVISKLWNLIIRLTGAFLKTCALMKASTLAICTVMCCSWDGSLGKSPGKGFWYTGSWGSALLRYEIENQELSTCHRNPLFEPYFSQDMFTLKLLYVSA